MVRVLITRQITSKICSDTDIFIFLQPVLREPYERLL